MTSLQEWSKTAANNNLASPDGFPEDILPSGLNNSFREVMASIKTGVVIWWDSVASMRAITDSPETGTRHALVDASNGTQVRFFEWKDAASGADDNYTIIRPTGTLSAGGFEEVGREGITTLTSHGSPINTTNGNHLLLFRDNGFTISSKSSRGRPGGQYWAWVTSGGRLQYNTSNTQECGNRRGKYWISENSVMFWAAVGASGGSYPQGTTSQDIVIARYVEDVFGTRRTATATQAVNAWFQLHSQDVWSVTGLVGQSGTATATLQGVNLTNIATNRFIDGAKTLLQPIQPGFKVIVKHGSSVGASALGNLRLAGGTDKTLSSVNDTLLLGWDKHQEYWVQLAYSANG